MNPADELMLYVHKEVRRGNAAMRKFHKIIRNLLTEVSRALHPP
jgi:hypothetical protein